MATKEGRFRGMLGSVELEEVRRRPGHTALTQAASKDQHADYALRRTGKVPVLKVAISIP